MYRKLSLYVLLAVLFTVQIVGVVALVGGLSYRSGQRAVEQLADELLTQTGDRVSQHLDDYLGEAQQVNQANLAAYESGLLDLGDQAALGKYFYRQCQLFDFTYINFGGQDGSFIGAGYDLSSDAIHISEITAASPNELHIYAADAAANRLNVLATIENPQTNQSPWYTDALESQQPIWSSVYNWRDLAGHNSIAASVPVYDGQQELLGVLGIDIELDQLSIFLQRLQGDRPGSISILERTGQIIASSAVEPREYYTFDQEAPLLDGLDSPDPLTRAVTQALLQRYGSLEAIAGPQQLRLTSVAGAPFVSVRPRFNAYGLDWLIVTVVPESEFLGEIYAQVRRTLALCGLALVGAIGSVVFVSRQITRSLSTLTQATQDFVAERPVEMPGVPGCLEVAALSESFRRMMVTLQETQQLRHRYAQTLEQQVSEKTTALQTLANQLQVAQRVARVGSWELDVATRQVIWSEELFRLSGREPNPTGQVDVHLSEIVHPEDWDRLHQAVETAIASHTPYEVEHRVILPDGALRHMVSRGEALRDGDNQVTRLAGTVADITERKQAELALQHSEAKGRAILEAIPDLMFRLSASGIYREVIRPQTAIDLLPAHVDRVGATARDILPAEVAEAYHHHIAQVLQTGEMQVYEQQVQLEGRLQHEEVRMVKSGEDEVLLMIRDISDRKRAENELRHYERIVAASTDGILLLNSDYAVQMVNQACLDKYGKTCDEVIGHPASQICDGQVFASEILPRLDRCLAGEVVQYRGWFDFARVGRRFVSINFVPYRDLNDAVSGVIINTRDVTASQQTAYALRESEQRFQEIASTISQCFFVQCAKTGRYTYVSPAYETIWHRSCQSLHDDPESWLASIHVDDRPNVAQSIAAQTARYSTTREYRIVRPSGEVRWVLVQIKAVRDDADRLKHFIGFAADISDRKTAELALQAREAQSQRLASNIAGMLYQRVRRADGTELYTYISPKCRDIYEIEPQHLLQDINCLAQRIHPEDVERLRAANQASAETLEPVDIEFRLHFSDGRQRWVRAVSQPERQDNGDVVWDGLALDITARKQTEFNLIQSEAKSRAILTAIPDLMVRVGADGVYREVVADNFDLEAFFNHQSPVGRSIEEILPPSVAQREMTVLAQALQAGELQIYEQSLQIGEHIRDEEVRVIKSGPDEVLFMVRDVSDRKRAEQALRDSESRFQTLIQNTPGVIYRYFPHLGESGRFTYISSGAQRLFELETAQILQDANALWGLIHPEDLPLLFASVETAVSRCADWQWEGRLITPSGQLKWIQGNARPQETPDGLAWDGLLIDISDRKQTELALKTSEERRWLALDLSQTGSWEFDVATGAAVWSDSHYRLMGLAPGELPASYSVWQDRVHPEDLEKAEQAFQDALESHQPLDVEYRVVHPDGTIRWMLTKGHGIYDGAGNPVKMSGVMLDVSDRKQTELALQTSEQRYRAIFEQVTVGINQAEPISGRFISANQAFCAMLGYTEAEILSLTYQDVTHPEDLAIHQESYRQLFDGHIPVHQHEKRYLHKEGHDVWVHINVSPLRNADGYIFSDVAVVVNIDAYKRAEAALSESELTSRVIVETMPDLLIQMDRQGRYTRMVGSSAAHVKYPPTESAESEPYDILSPKLYERRLHYVNQAFDCECIQVYEQSFEVEGDQRFEEVRIAPLNPQEVLVIVRDITDRKRVELELQQLNQALEDQVERRTATIQEQAALLNIASDAIMVRDLEQRIRYWNQGAERLYEWRASEAIGQQANELLQVVSVRISTILETLLSQGEWRGELWKVTKSGKTVTVESRWTLVRDDGGQPKFILSVDTDVTEKKQLEAQFYQTQRLDSLGRLASGIAHDLNNVLTPILTMSQLLRLTRPDLAPKAREQLQLVEDSAKRGTELVKQILTFTRGSEGDRVPVDILLLLQEVIDIAHQSFPKSIEVAFDLPDPSPTGQSPWTVEADPTHLHQVFMNLCINARDAMPDGGTLTLTVRQEFVDEALARQHLDAQIRCYVVVTVKDTGVGMTPEVRDRIFDPFFTTKEPSKGTGLGLSTVLGIVKNHDGFLRVFTEVEQGTCIKVYLPTTEAIPTEADAIEAQLSGQGEWVLIVDDDKIVQRTTQALFESYHYQTLVASDGFEAIRHYQQHQNDISVVVLDIMMPNMDGTVLTRRLKSIDPEVNIIAISGLLANQDAALAAGANAFLAKPYPLEDLLRTVQALLGEPH